MKKKKSKGKHGYLAIAGGDSVKLAQVYSNYINKKNSVWDYFCNGGVEISFSYLQLRVNMIKQRERGGWMSALEGVLGWIFSPVYRIRVLHILFM